MPYYFHPVDPDRDPSRTRRPTCAECGQRIVWIRSAKPPHRKIKCNGGDLVYGDSQRTLVTPGGHMISKAPDHVLGREPHFGRNCPIGSLDRIAKSMKNRDRD